MSQTGEVINLPIGRRLSVNVALDVGDAIESIAERNGITVTEVIRRAVSAYKRIDDAQASGAVILVKRGGAVSEVKFA